jgi:lipoprotein-anchoring transpeptidase ErfK/SrfK
MKRAALVAGVSVTALICAGATHAVAAPQYASPRGFGFFRPMQPAAPVRKIEKKSKPVDSKAALADADKTPPIPKGPLHIIVSIDKQRATLYADGHPVAQTKISSGTATHPTPMGVFSILQKNRHHVSNLYDAKMPYMQRITWSGAALHEGPLPGYPASHGCVRLPNEFAQLLWKATKIGARVIIARDEAQPVEIAHERLFVAQARAEAPKVEPKPEIRPEIRREPESKPEPRPDSPKPELRGPKLDIISERKAVPARSGETIETRAATGTVKTADAMGSVRVPALPDVAVKPLTPTTARNTAAPEQPTKLPLHGDVDEIAMPPAPAANGATAAIARPAPVVVAERPAPVVAERPAAVAPMAKADVIKQGRIEPPVTPPAVQPATTAEAPVAAAPAAATEPPRRKGTVSVFVSLKENRVYVRQNMEALFDAPVSIARPGEPIGTHVYTAMGAKPDGSMRWTVVSIPSAYKPAPEVKTADVGRKPRHEQVVKAIERAPAPLPSAGTALDRIVMPQETVERIASLITPGASLIVSDNKLSGETGATTDFIVETKQISDAADGMARQQPRRLAPRQYY